MTMRKFCISKKIIDDIKKTGSKVLEVKRFGLFTYRESYLNESQNLPEPDIYSYYELDFDTYYKL